ncbi:MAG: hypothetical protein ACI9FU_001994 [Granulosicoccus sp.]|jgi:hypothetical protein
MTLNELRLLTVTCVLVLMQGLSYGQVTENYEPLRAKGLIPDIFLTSPRQRAVTEIAQLPDSLDFKVKQARKSFAVKSNFLLEELLHSGAILFNDTVTQYVNEVGAYVLSKNEDASLAKIQFYVLKSQTVNAFATHQNVVFVTLGLLSRLKSEAELGFVLSHEISHIKLHHVVNLYLEGDELINGRKYKSASFDEKIQMISSYSKEAEFEADSLGFIMFSNTEYEIEESIHVFDMLKYASLSAFEDEHCMDVFEPMILRSDTQWLLQGPFILLDIGDEDNESGTHPSIGSRQLKMREYIAAAQSELQPQGDSRFITSQKWFDHIVKVSTYEVAHLQLSDQDYTSALYTANYLRRKYGDGTYLNGISSKAMYGIAKYKTYQQAGPTYLLGVDLTEDGQFGRVQHFVKNTYGKLINQFAIKYIYENAESSGNKRLHQFVIDLMIDKINKYNGKYDSLLARCKLTGPTEKFKELFDQAKSQAAAFDLIDDEWTPTDGQDLGHSSNAVERRRWRKENKNAVHQVPDPIDSLIIVGPVFYTFHYKKGVNRVKSVELELHKGEQIAHCAEKNGVETEFLSFKNLKKTEGERYSDICQLRYWVEESIAHEEYMHFVSTDAEYVSFIKEKYGITKVALPVMLHRVNDRRRMLWFTVLFWVPPAWPFFLTGIFTLRDHSMFANFVFDAESGRFLLFDYRNGRGKPSRRFINRKAGKYFRTISGN